MTRRTCGLFYPSRPTVEIERLSSTGPQQQRRLLLGSVQYSKMRVEGPGGRGPAGIDDSLGPCR